MQKRTANATRSSAHEHEHEGAIDVARNEQRAEHIPRPSELGSHTSAGSACLKTVMICVNSEARRKPSSTAFLEQQSDVLPSPDCESAFQIAPEEPPSVRLKRRISR